MHGGMACPGWGAFRTFFPLKRKRQPGTFRKNRGDGAIQTSGPSKFFTGRDPGLEAQEIRQHILREETKRVTITRGHNGEKHRRVFNVACACTKGVLPNPPSRTNGFSNPSSHGRHGPLRTGSFVRGLRLASKV